MIASPEPAACRPGLRYDTIRAAIDGRLTGNDASMAIGLSRRQVERLKAKIRSQGAAGVQHGNAGRTPWNKTPPTLRQRVIDLATGEYAAYNFPHLADTLAQNYHILCSDETLRRWLRPLGHGRPLRRAKVHTLRRRRKDHEGEWLFLDGSPHQWSGPDHETVCLLLATDDATGKPLWGKFQPTEDRDGCFEVCYQVFRKFGLNGFWYLDRASQFKTTRHGGLHVAQRLDQDDTPFQQAMERLAVGLHALTHGHPRQWCSNNRATECSLFTIGQIVIGLAYLSLPPPHTLFNTLRRESWLKGNWG